MGKGSASGDGRDGAGDHSGATDATVAATPVTAPAGAGDKDSSAATDATMAATPVTAVEDARDAETRSLIVPADRDAETQTLGEAATEHAGDVPSGSDSKPSGGARRGGTTLRRGDRLEQFLILDQLGAGGMGVVVAAHDPDLDRKVAIKVLRAEKWAKETESAGRLRLLREAQAMAKLQHPNVITVHEVGTVDDQVFVAMEFVDGPTLGEWLKLEKPGWRDIVAKFVDAGRGLAAAHAAGLVHRDFKPANVLVGKDGRVRVTDFGLVGALDDEVEEVPAPELRGGGLMSSSGSGLGTPLAITLTCAGQILGTPVYMAPEQHMGQKVDARADQFAFAVALYEALCGKRPFSRGQGYEDLATNVCRGKVRPFPREANVPQWLQKIVLRSLAVDPDQRFATMDEMLVALQKDPAVARRRAVGIGAVVVLAGLAGYGLLGRGGGASGPRCDTGAARLAGVWDESVKAAVHDKFIATGLSYAEDTYGRVETALDDYAAGWKAMHKDACEATHVRGEQSGQLLDARMRCLDRRLGALGALTRVYAEQADANAVNGAVRAVLNLTKLDTCADADALLAAVPPPEDPVVRQRTEELSRRLDEIKALKEAGKFVKAAELIGPLAEEVKSTRYPPLQAETAYIQAALTYFGGDPKGAEKHLLEAAEFAAEARDDLLMVRAWVGSVLVVGYLQARYSEALAMGRLAETAVARVGGNPAVLGQLIVAVAAVLGAQGKDREAEQQYQRALKLLVEGFGPEHPEVATCLTNLGNVLVSQGKRTEALGYYRRGQEIRELTLGPDHPDVSDSLTAVALLLEADGKIEEAYELASRGLVIRERGLGPQSPRVASLLNIVGELVQKKGEFDRAETLFQRSFEIWSASLGGDHPNITHPLVSLGRLALERGQYDRAREYFDRVLAIRSRSLSAEHPDIGSAWRDLGRLALARKDYRQAGTLCHKALAIHEAGVANAHPEIVEDLLCVGGVELERQNPRAGVAAIQRALEMVETVEVGLTRYEVYFMAARVFSAAGGDEKRAVDLAKKAAAGYENVGAKKQVAEVSAWLSRRRQR